ncbi:MAG: transcription antitermination factor NusB [Lachnospiraceae bacterium]|nr:transcription antitermination factor NusB [Lachnospiraceae bacterium]
MRRKICREQIFRLLFQVEFNDKEDYPYLNERMKSFGEFTLEPDEEEYVEAKFEKITEHIEEIDEVLNENSIDWKTSRMGKAELAILRLAYYEMVYDDDIPESVAINEAVELAKKYGPEESYSFVNGVLAKCAKTQDKHREAIQKKDKTKPWKETGEARIVVKGSKTKK